MKSAKTKKRFSSIFFQNLFSHALLVLLSMLMLGGCFVVISYSYTMKRSRANMEGVEREAVRILSAYSDKWDMDGFEIKMALSSFAYTSGYHMMICDMSGQIVSCGDQEMPCEHLGAYISSYTLHSMEVNNGYAGVTNLDGVFEKTRLVVAQKIISGATGELCGYLLVSCDVASLVDIWRSVSGIFLGTSGAVLLLALGAAYITTRRQVRPIDALAKAAGKFSYGDFSVRVEEKGPDELRELAVAFNSMAEYLERAENTRRELIGNVSHELKTPMTTITGFAEGILDGTIPPEKEREYLQVISSETKRLSRLVRSMLDISQMQSKDPKIVLQSSFNLSEVALSVLVSLEKKINDKKLDVDVQIPEEPVFVQGDGDAITQVIYNLTDNAIKFSYEGTTLRFLLKEEAGKMQFAVENTGAAIPAEEIPVIFDRFHKSDKSRSMDKEGVGLGLYIVKTILQNHRETITVTSQDGVTRFSFGLKKAECSENCKS